MKFNHVASKISVAVFFYEEAVDKSKCLMLIACDSRTTIDRNTNSSHRQRKIDIYYDELPNSI